MALLIKLDSRGPVLYKQERVGMDGRIFLFLKFRTMRDGRGRPRAPRVPAPLHRGAPRHEPRRQPAPRLQTPRRPARHAHGALAPPHESRRVAAALERPARRHERRRPAPADSLRGRGVRALAPQAARHEAGDDGALAGLGAQPPLVRRDGRLDLFYIENWSLWLDLKIILRTLPVLLRGEAY
jgi:hypothetical protein